MDPIETHPEYIRAKERLISLGLKWEWLTYIPDPSIPPVTFLKNGKLCYCSPCPHYEGYWLGLGFGCVKCSAANHPVPGTYLDFVCRERHETCPYWMAEKQTQQERTGPLVEDPAKEEK